MIRERTCTQDEAQTLFQKLGVLYLPGPTGQPCDSVGEGCIRREYQQVGFIWVHLGGWLLLPYIYCSNLSLIWSQILSYDHESITWLQAKAKTSACVLDQRNSCLFKDIVPASLLFVLDYVVCFSGSFPSANRLIVMSPLIKNSSFDYTVPLLLILFHIWKISSELFIFADYYSLSPLKPLKFVVRLIMNSIMYIIQWSIFSFLKIWSIGSICQNNSFPPHLDYRMLLFLDLLSNPPPPPTWLWITVTSSYSFLVPSHST